MFCYKCFVINVFFLFCYKCVFFVHACACALMLWHMRKCLRTTCRRQFSYHVGSVDPTQVECQKEKRLLSSTYQSKRNPELPGCWLSIWETLEFLLLTIDGWSLFLFGVFMTAHLSSFWVCLSSDYPTPHLFRSVWAFPLAESSNPSCESLCSWDGNSLFLALCV